LNKNLQFVKIRIFLPIEVPMMWQLSKVILVMVELVVKFIPGTGVA
jgi:hypothetical protein